jgi:hypothetical protein
MTFDPLAALADAHDNQVLTIRTQRAEIATLRAALEGLRIAAVEVVIEATSTDFDPTTREWGELIEGLEARATAQEAGE